VPFDADHGKHPGSLAEHRLDYCRSSPLIDSDDCDNGQDGYPRQAGRPLVGEPVHECTKSFRGRLRDASAQKRMPKLRRQSVELVQISVDDGGPETFARSSAKARRQMPGHVHPLCFR